MLLDMLLAAVYKPANPGVPFIFINADWLNPQERKKRKLVIELTQFPLCVLMEMKLYLVFDLLK